MGRRYWRTRPDRAFSGPVVVYDCPTEVSYRVRFSQDAFWYLPPYSPDLNPIELCFAKLKTLVRAARCRSTEMLGFSLGTVAIQVGDEVWVGGIGGRDRIARFPAP